MKSTIKELYTTVHFVKHTHVLESQIRLWKTIRSVQANRFPFVLLYSYSPRHLISLLCYCNLVLITILFYRSFLLLNVFQNLSFKFSIPFEKGHFVYLLYKEIPNSFIRHIRPNAFTFPQKSDSRKYVSFTSTPSTFHFRSRNNLQREL